ncbi:MAG TPA: class I SAM-dependent methyltransferase, partial [Burkholderiales bacterium]|nr:class I SAM-dependent methyltransferase [Burkholderiales bacterium]
MMRAVLAVFLLSFLSAGPALAQKYEPQVGQAGKDVIWVPTPDEVVERMLTMAQVGPNDIHFDLGAGDGKIAIAAAKRGANATGIEYNPDMAKYANERARAAGVAGVGAGKATIRQADIFATDFSQATVITMYLLPGLNMKLRPQLLAMKPGTRVVSHSFTMEDWEADEVVERMLTMAQVGPNDIHFDL